MKIVILQLANDEVCVCSRCTRPGGDGGGRAYKPVIQAMRETWAAEEVEGVKIYYIYGHREGIEFPQDSPMIESHERYWPYGSAGDGFEPVDIDKKRAPFAIGDCIYSDTPEGRENIYYKTIDGFQWLVENEEFDYLMRCSAGSYIDLKILKQFLEQYGVKDNIYAGSVGHFNNNHASATQPPHIKFGSGSGFIASRNLIEDIVKNRLEVDPVRSPYASATIADDVTFGKHFSYDLGVDLIAFNKHEFRHPSQITPAVKNYMQCYFVHTIDPQMLYAVHEAKGLTRKVV